MFLCRDTFNRHFKPFCVFLASSVCTIKAGTCANIALQSNYEKNKIKQYLYILTNFSTAIQLADELKQTAQAERTELLQQTGFRVRMTEVTTVEGLAMKVDLAIPWNKAPSPKKVDTILIIHFARGEINCFAHCLIRWLSEWGVKIASEKCQRALAKTWTAESTSALMLLVYSVTFLCFTCGLT